VTTMNPNGDLVLVRTKAGRIHRAVQVGEARFVDERCNLDEAPGTERVITFAELEHADAADVCQRCWPPESPRVPA
jgi:hypothetical protein